MELWVASLFLSACHARSRRLRIEMGVVGDVEEKKGKGGLGYEKPEGKKKKEKGATAALKERGFEATASGAVAAGHWDPWARPKKKRRVSGGESKVSKTSKGMSKVSKTSGGGRRGAGATAPAPVGPRRGCWDVVAPGHPEVAGGGARRRRAPSPEPSSGHQGVGGGRPSSDGGRG